MGEQPSRRAPRARSEDVLEGLVDADRKRTDDLPELVELALDDARVLDAVVAGALARGASSAPLAARAAWVLRRVVEAGGALSPGQRAALLRDATRSEFWEVRAELCHVLPRLPLTARQVARAVAFLQSCPSDASRVVQAWGMDALCRLAEQRPALRPIAEAGLVRGEDSPSPAVRARVRHIRRRLGRGRPG